MGTHVFRLTIILSFATRSYQLEPHDHSFTYALKFDVERFATTGHIYFTDGTSVIKY